jgi:hypothetical protein
MKCRQQKSSEKAISCSCSQIHYRVSDLFSPYLHILLKSILTIFSALSLGLPSDSLRFLDVILCSLVGRYKRFGRTVINKDLPVY